MDWIVISIVFFWLVVFLIPVFESHAGIENIDNEKYGDRNRQFEFQGFEISKDALIKVAPGSDGLVILVLNPYCKYFARQIFTIDRVIRKNRQFNHVILTNEKCEISFSKISFDELPKLFLKFKFLIWSRFRKIPIFLDPRGEFFKEYVVKRSPSAIVFDVSGEVLYSGAIYSSSITESGHFLDLVLGAIAKKTPLPFHNRTGMGTFLNTSTDLLISD